MIDQKLTVIKKNDLLNSSINIDSSIYSTDFNSSKSYNSFLYNEYLALKDLLLGCEANPIILEYYNQLNNQPSIAFQIYGPAKIYYYIWKNGELKSLVTRGNHIIVDTDFWLPFYPFVDILTRSNQGKNIKEISINESLFLSLNSNLELGAYNLQPNMFFSHNDHFGHFVLDDLPSLLLNILSFPTFKELNLFFPYKNSLKDIFNYFVDDIIINDLHSSCILNSKPLTQNYCHSSPKFLDCYFTNIMINSYLLKQHYINHIQPRILKEDSKSNPYIFLIRSGEYTSRIFNQAEIISFCSSYGFSLVNPSKFSAFELFSLFKKSKCIISESGSSTLVANIFSPPECNIISLIPERLLKNPDNNMLISGLPYHFTFPSKIKILLGKTIQTSSIQSSDIAFYETSKLKTILDSL